MGYCKKCVLSDKIFSVKINKDGLCNYCSSKEEQKITENNQNVDEAELPLEQKDKEYDVVLAYSGGKDSTYTLYLLREKYKLNVLAVTYDNGFLAPETYGNIKNVCSHLNVDSVIIAPSVSKMHQIFKLANEDTTLPLKSMERASAICTYCIGLVKMCVYKEAIQRKIPLIAFGWTPGQINMNKQIVKLDYRLLKMNFKKISENIMSSFGETYQSLILSERLLDNSSDYTPSLFYPFPNHNYNESEIIATISKLGWSKPGGTDSNSTNCMLNAYAIKQHKEKYGFHPYAFELAGLVREGLMDREEALRRIETEDDLKMINEVELRLQS